MKTNLFRHTLQALASMLTLGAGAQTTIKESSLNHPAGFYPGAPTEDFAPTVQRSRSNDYRNLAFLRPAYHSSSYDYNLTAQLITDGITATERPWWIRVIGPEGEMSKKNREYLLDGMPWSSIRSSEKLVPVVIEFSDYLLDVDDEWQLTTVVSNPDKVPAVMTHLVARGSDTHERLLPVIYSDNYFSLMPGESKTISVTVKVADSKGQQPEITF